MGERPVVRYEVIGQGRPDHAQPARAGQRDHARAAAELVDCVERADLDPAVHVVLLSGNGPGLLRRV